MLTTLTGPITSDWTNPDHQTARDLSQRLARLKVGDVDPSLVPYLAAAAAELSLSSGIRWTTSHDDPPVALLRLIAKATLRAPHAGGPHTSRLLAQLG